MIVALLVIALVPVFPVYYVVRYFLQSSLEVGYNRDVGEALESAAGVTRELYGTYRQQVLESVMRIAELPITASVVTNGTLDERQRAELRLGQNQRLTILDNTGAIAGQIQMSDAIAFPQIFENQTRPLRNEEKAGFIDGPKDRAFIVAFSPIESPLWRQGTAVLTSKVDDDFMQRSEAIIKVNQIFKTLDFIEDDLSRIFVLPFVVIYLPIAGLSVALGVYFSRRITRPIESLSEGTKRIAEGNWRYRVEKKTSDEIGQLVDAFNHMVSTIKEKQDQVISLEKMAAWREIARILAHEIKNPLTPIQLTVQQLRDKYAGTDPEYRKLLEECTEIITDEIETLRTLVREFSEFARMPKLSLEPGNLNELLEEIGKLYARDNIHLYLSETLPDFSFDHEKMRRVVINLVENGLDSIREKGAGEISLKTEVSGERIRLLYSDTGNGMPVEIQDKIFEPYFSTKKSGMGLGMAVVKRVVDEHGGRIWFESESGAGTRFFVELPQTLAPQPPVKNPEEKE